MDYSEACRRLQNHANLPNSGPEHESLGLALWRISRGEPPPPNLAALFDDVIECLEIVNVALNGRIPSETPNAMKKDQIDRWLCYSVSCLFDLFIEAVNSQKADGRRDVIFGMMRDLSIAWNCVLAGDIDRIATYLDIEQQKGGPKDGPR
ncbi:MAG: hypothetical protein KatS3mg111_2970 [Pirellulaceae bacterium]|nr:MAG: hypothetical protein KatS3mg111_2970 [Pirellulaceae bacterium]